MSLRQLQRGLLGVALVASSVAICGCSVINAFEDPPIVGSWRGTAASRPDSRMEVELEGEGDASFSVLFSGDTTTSTNKFDLEWEQIDESRYSLSFECRSSNHPQGICGLPFKLRCDINDDGDKLNCVDRSGVWKIPEFVWKLD